MDGKILRASNRPGYAVMVALTWVGTFDTESEAVAELRKRGIDRARFVNERGASFPVVLESGRMVHDREGA